VASTDGKAPLAPASRYVHYGARVPRRSQPFADPNLPSIIVDVESDCLALVERMMAGDERAQDLLLEMGESAAHVLAARLPGPLGPARPTGLGTGRPLVPSRSSPLLATLVRLGRTAVPSVIERSRDPDPVVRAWATRVLGELPWPESARAVAARIPDEDPEVRNAALAAGRMLQADRDSRAALRQALEAVCFDSAQPAEARRLATSALGELRDDRAVPALIALLEDTDSDLAATAHRALVGLTAQDFGPSRFRYTNWWNTHQISHRIEWLIDALTHDHAEIRRAAGEELKAVTKEYFGYYDDLPPAERASAQQRYREWWNSRGKALFG
jgi:HEAT repeat protein